MNLEFACLADEAAAADDKLYIHGGGLRRMLVPQVPWVIHLAVAARFNAGLDELGDDHILHLQLEMPDDQVFFPLPPTEITLGLDNIVEDTDQLGLAVVFRIGAIAVRETGWYRFTLLLDVGDDGADRLVTLPLRIVVPAPVGSGLVP
jgi:hypothetical protein